MKIALFLGAGASVPYNKPTTITLKNDLLKKYENNEIFKLLLSYQTFTDIEYVLTAVKQVVSFRKTLGGNFCRTYTGNFTHYVSEIEKFEEVLESEIFENYSWKHEDDETVTKILTPIFDLIKQKNKDITVFTTNYDRSIEEYCSNPNHQIRCIDGFHLNQYNGRFLWAKGDYGYLGKNDNGTDVFLYKIHGSLNWKKHTKYGIERTTYERKPAADSNYDEDFLIYPTLSPKNEAESKEPYNIILDRFDESLKFLDVCIVIGFSFRDEHINQKFADFVNVGKKLIVIGPNAVTDFRINVLGHEPTEEEKEHWKQSESQQLHEIKDDENSVKWDIHFIQKRLEVDTINKIVHDIQRAIEPKKHPF